MGPDYDAHIDDSHAGDYSSSLFEKGKKLCCKQERTEEAIVNKHTVFITGFT
jgi:hypothetical protein